MSLRSRPGERVRRIRVWLVPAGLLALTPKCVLCLLAYAGAGSALGLAGPEICGATNADQSWATALVVSSVALFATIALAKRNHARKCPPVHSAGSISINSTSKVRPDSGGTLPA
jgi:hypothetical protein